MNFKIQPKIYDVKVKCSCGNTLNLKSTRQNLSTEVCYACHPFYTGKKSIVDMTGRVEKFRKKMTKTKNIRNKIEENKERVKRIKSDSPTKPAKLKASSLEKLASDKKNKK